MLLTDSAAASRPHVGLNMPHSHAAEEVMLRWRSLDGGCSARRTRRRTQKDVGEVVGPEDAAAGREELRQRHVVREHGRAGDEQDAGEQRRVDGAVAVRPRRQHHVREAVPGWTTGFDQGRTEVGTRVSRPLTNRWR